MVFSQPNLGVKNTVVFLTGFDKAHACECAHRGVNEQYLSNVDESSCFKLFENISPINEF